MFLDFPYWIVFRLGEIGMNSVNGRISISYTRSGGYRSITGLYLYTHRKIDRIDWFSKKCSSKLHHSELWRKIPFILEKVVALKIEKIE